MTTKTLLITGALALASLAYGKSYDIVLSSPTQAGSVQLKAGEYSLKVVNGQAVFTDVQTAKSFTAPVKMQNAAKKFDTTSVDTSKANGSEQIKTIELGGSTTQLAFGE
jgi:hypothetical protein